MSGLRRRCFGVGVDPVAVAGLDGHVRIVLELERDRVKTRCRGLWLERQHVTVRDVVGDGEEIALQRLRVLELVKLAAGEVCDGFGDVVGQRIVSRHLGDFAEAQRRKQLGETVEVLRRTTFAGLNGLAVCIGAEIAAEAAVRGAGIERWLPHVAELTGFATGVRGGDREADAVDDRVGIADGAQRVGERGVAGAVGSFRQQEDGATVGRRLRAQQVDGEGESVERGGLPVTASSALSESLTVLRLAVNSWASTGVLSKLTTATLCWMLAARLSSMGPRSRY